MTPFRSRSVLALAALFTVASLAGGSGARAQTLTTIRVGTLGQDANAEAFYAQDLGIFRKYGLDADIQIIRRGGGAAVAAAITGGALDVGDGDIVTVAHAHQHGVSLMLLAPSSLYREGAPTTEVVAVNGSPIKTAKDLEGKTVGIISLEGPSRVATDAWLDANGVDKSQVKYVELPPTEMAAAVDRGTVAAAVINEPALTASRSCCHVIGNPFASVGKEWFITGWFADANWIQKNPDVAKRFVQAIHETALWANDPANHAQSAEILNKYTPFPPALRDRVTRATYGVSFTMPSLQLIIDAALKEKAIDAPLAARAILSPLAPVQ